MEIESVHFTTKISAFLTAAVIVLIARIISIYPVLFILNRFKTNIPARWQHVLVWGGLRGSLSLALVLGLPSDLPYRSELLTITFGVVLFSLLVQGLTIKPLLKLLKIGRKNDLLHELNLHHAYIVINNRALKTLDNEFSGGKIDPVLYEKKKDEIETELSLHHDKITSMYGINPDLKEIAGRELDIKLLHSKAKTVEELIKREKISHEEGEIILNEIDNLLKNAEESQDQNH